jgi:hypothetical protein
MNFSLIDHKIQLKLINIEKRLLKNFNHSIIKNNKNCLLMY